MSRILQTTTNYQHCDIWEREMRVNYKNSNFTLFKTWGKEPAADQWKLDCEEIHFSPSELR